MFAKLLDESCLQCALTNNGTSSSGLFPVGVSGSFLRFFTRNFPVSTCWGRLRFNIGLLSSMSGISCDMLNLNRNAFPYPTYSIHFHRILPDACHKFGDEIKKKTKEPHKSLQSNVSSAPLL